MPSSAPTLENVAWRTWFRSIRMFITLWILSYNVTELIKSKGHPSKSGGAWNLDFNQNTGINFDSIIFITCGSKLLIKVWSKMFNESA